MTDMIRQGLGHNGFAFLEIAQACPTYNKLQTHEWYLEHIRDVSDMDTYDHTDIWQARKIVDDLDGVIPTGLIYHRESPNFLDRLEYRKDYATVPVEEVRKYNISDLV